MMSHPNEELYQAESPNMSNHDGSDQRDIESPDLYRDDPEFEDDLWNQLQRLRATPHFLPDADKLRDQAISVVLQLDIVSSSLANFVEQ
ncbi:hypothetical protein RB195_025156 [Necator americanus]|uniref:Uncharacterized protein n=1 Tax=Necator americanus TaxID=51031 RepID=A0ABR1ER47_NECAM